jgi:hypothetical protein
MPVFTPTRHTFLQTAVAVIASLFLPRGLLARRSSRPYWFLHTPTGESWAVDDPVAWALENARQPILERASQRLVTLDGSDPQRIIRLVVRRCRLNLLDLRTGRVVIHHWGQQGNGDLRPFFKQHGLARHHVEAVLLDRKRDTTTVRTGADFLYGEPLAEEFPLSVYHEKWQRRASEEPDDCQPAPCSFSNYCWEGAEQNCIPWRVLKSAWRHEESPLCQNCDRPTILTAFGYVGCGFYTRGPRVVRICPQCENRFENFSPWDGPAWMLANLDGTLLPSVDVMFEHPVKYTLPWTAEGQAHQRMLRQQCVMT